jgi:DNA polymerase-3 subunit beta
MPLPGAGLLELIRKTVFAVGDNDARYVLNGLLVTVIPANGKATIRLVGTDGHRLAIAEQEVTLDPSRLPTEETKVIIPKKAATEIRRLLEENDIEPLIGFTRSMLIFRKSGLVLTSRVMEGTYPNYQQVVPKESPNRIELPKKDFEGALRRVSLLSRDRSFAVKITVGPDRVTLFSSNPEFGEANEEIPVQFKGEGFSTGFSARYLLDVLGVMDGDTLSLQMDSPLSPCLVQEQGNSHFKAVVMPVKV